MLFFPCRLLALYPSLVFCLTKLFFSLLRLCPCTQQPSAPSRHYSAASSKGFSVCPAQNNGRNPWANQERGKDVLSSKVRVESTVLMNCCIFSNLKPHVDVRIKHLLERHPCVLEFLPRIAIRSRNIVERVLQLSLCVIAPTLVACQSFRNTYESPLAFYFGESGWNGGKEWVLPHRLGSDIDIRDVRAITDLSLTEEWEDVYFALIAKCQEKHD